MQTIQKPWQRLTITRELAGYSLTALAKAAGISVGHINDLEKGRREPTPITTSKVARVLNVPITYIEKHDRIEGRTAA